MLSMTGYGRSAVEDESYRVLVEVKTVNHRYCDISIKSPKKIFALEERVRNRVQQKIARGRVEVYIKCEEITKSNYRVKPDFNVLDQYNDAFNEISNRYALHEKPNLDLLFKCSDAFDVQYEDADEEAIWLVLEQALEQSLDKLCNMRKKEGLHLKQDIQHYIVDLKKYSLEVGAKAPEISMLHKEKMTKRIKELLDDDIQIDQEKLAYEIAVFADKTAIDEEIVRLSAHIEQFSEAIDVKGAIGRKLDFIIQEMNREVNTIGSKSPDIDISENVINMKSIIEKMREQIQNIE